MSARDVPRVRLAELIATLSLASDIALGKPYEHAQRGAIGAVRIGEALGLGETDLRDTYYLTLLKSIGCVGDDDLGYRLLGEDVGTWASHLGMASPFDFLTAILRNTGKGMALPRRIAKVARAFSGLPNMMQALKGHCEVAYSLAGRLRLGERVSRGLAQVYERWDGTGEPSKLKGAAIELPVRLAQLALDADAGYKVLGGDATVGMIKSRAGKGYDPEIVVAFGREAPRIFAETSAPSIWDAVLAAEPGAPTYLTGDDAVTAIRSMGEYADLKSRYTHGHSTAVSALASAGARRLRLPDSDVTALEWAGYLHDIGRMGTPAMVWDKEGALTDAEWERVRLHAYHTDRILARASSLGPAAALAGADHERLDGSGYHRRLPHVAISPAARILAAADAYQAMTERRPHRAAMSVDQAAGELRKEARSGRLDGEAVEAVLSVAGHKTRAQPARPGGLSDRELDVLRLVAHGLTNKEVASSLEISVKTAGHHLEHIYDKLGVTTRAAAALFAMQHDLLGE